MKLYALRVITTAGSEIYRALGSSTAIRKTLEQRPYLNDPPANPGAVLHVELLGGGRQWATLESLSTPVRPSLAQG